MSKEQIEEIAKTCPYNVDGECMLDETRCTTDCEVAKWGHSITEGYRKQSEPISCGREKGGWISVDERLPDHCEKILVCDTSQNISTGVYYVYSTGGGDFCTPIRIKEQITHWMPLPEPPGMKGGAE